MLVLGCGTSTLPLGLAADGFAVTATDIAPAAIARMRAHPAAVVGGLPHSGWPGRRLPGRAGRARPQAAAGSCGRVPSVWAGPGRAWRCMLWGVPNLGHEVSARNSAPPAAGHGEHRLARGGHAGAALWLRRL